MTYKITYTKRFEKHLRTLSKNEKDLIKKKVAKLVFHVGRYSLTIFVTAFILLKKY